MIEMTDFRTDPVPLNCLLKWKKKKRLTSRQIASQVGSSFRNIQGILTGERPPSNKIALKLKEITGLSWRAIMSTFTVDVGLFPPVPNDIKPFAVRYQYEDDKWYGLAQMNGKIYLLVEKWPGGEWKESREANPDDIQYFRENKKRGGKRQ